MKRTVRRLAWRDLRGHKAMSLAAILLIALPVILILTLGTVWMRGGVEKLTGDVQAKVTLHSSVMRQDGTGMNWFSDDSLSDDVAGMPVVETLSELVAPNTLTLEMEGEQHIELINGDMLYPLAGQLAASASQSAIIDGEFPSDGEIAVSPMAAATLGASIGDEVSVASFECADETDCGYDLEPIRISGITDGAWIYSGVTTTLETLTFGEISDGYWVEGTVTGTAPVTWEKVKELNGYGLLVQSQAVQNNPPSPDEVEDYLGMDPDGYTDTLSVVATASLIILGVMEVLLIISPAFTIAAKRNERNLAQIAAVGGTPRDLRSLMLTQGLTLGVIGGLLGVAGGLAGVAIFNAKVFGGTLVTPWWLPLAAFAAAVFFGLLAALWPARNAGRIDIVAVLNNRQAGRVPSRRTAIIAPIISLFCAVAVAFFVHGVWAVLAILIGLITLALSAPLFVRVGAWLVGRISFPFRLGGRDVVRNMHRSGPAVAAITIATAVATVAASYAFLILGGTYRSEVSLGNEGDVILASSDPYGRLLNKDMLDLALEEFDEVRPVSEVREMRSAQGPTAYVEVALRPDEECQDDPGDPRCEAMTSPIDGLGLPNLVLDETDVDLLKFDESVRAEAAATLEAGGVLTTNPFGVHDGTVTIRAAGWNPETDEEDVLATFDVPATVIPSGTQVGPLVLSPEAAAKTGLDVNVSALIVTPTDPATISDTQRDKLGRWSSSEGVVRAVQINAPNYDMTIGSLATLLISLIVVLGTSILVVILGSRAARADLDTIDAVGAKPGLRRRFSAAVAGIITMSAVIPGYVTGLFGYWLLTGATRLYSSSIIIPVAIVIVVTIIGYLFPPKRLGLTRRMD